MGFGRWFIAKFVLRFIELLRPCALQIIILPFVMLCACVISPDLVERLRTGQSFNRYNRATFYTYGSYGYEREKCNDGCGYTIQWNRYSLLLVVICLCRYTDYPTFENVPDHSQLVPQDKIGATLKDTLKASKL